MQVDSQLGFDWGGLLTNVAQAATTYTAQKNAAKVQLARIAAENQQAIAAQRAALAAAVPPSALQPTQGGGYFSAAPPIVGRMTLNDLLIPGAVGVLILLVLVATRR